MADKRSQSSDRSRATAHDSDSQPVAADSTSECLKPACFSNKATSTSPLMLEDRTDSNSESKPVEQESEQDTLIRQQIGSREAAPAVEVADKRGQSPGVAPRLGSSDEEEKRDQSKEEPPLELNQQKGWLRLFWQWRAPKFVPKLSLLVCVPLDPILKLLHTSTLTSMCGDKCSIVYTVVALGQLSLSSS